MDLGVLGVIITIVGGVGAFLLRRIFIRLDDFDVRLRISVDEKQVRRLIEDHLAVISSQQADIREDIKEIKTKIDKLLDHA